MVFSIITDAGLVVGVRWGGTGGGWDDRFREMLCFVGVAGSAWHFGIVVGAGGGSDGFGGMCCHH
jgi:hypothetical protein